MQKQILLVLLFLTFLIPQPVFGQQAAVLVRVSPETLQIPQNQITAIAVEVVDIQELFGMEIEMTFDPAVLEVQDADPELAGVQISLGDFLDPGFVIVNQVDNETGVLRLAMTQLYPSTPKSGTGNLIVVSFRGKQIGAQSELNLVSVKLASNTGNEILSIPESGVIEVVESVPGPTYTPIPTQGAGTPLPTLGQSATPTATTSTSQPTATTAPTNTAQPAASNTPQQPTPTSMEAPENSDVITPTATNPNESSTQTDQITPTGTPIIIELTSVAENSSSSGDNLQTNNEVVDALEPVQPTIQTVYPIWLIVLVGLFGIIIGGVSVYFAGRRRKDDKDPSTSERGNENK